MAEPGFTKGNSYLFSKDIYTWNLPSGYTCPGAEKCFGYADKLTGKLHIGKHTEFRCYSSVTERFPAVRDKAWANYDLARLADTGWMNTAYRISELIPKKARLIRIHASGDFFSQAYFDAWLWVCTLHPSVHFWAFTKSLNYWLQRRDCLPPNINMTASYGGKHDHLIKRYGLKYAKVVYSEAEADALKLQIDAGDRLAAYGDESFALLENFKARKPLLTLL